MFKKLYEAEYGQLGGEPYVVSLRIIILITRHRM